MDPIITFGKAQRAEELAEKIIEGSIETGVLQTNINQKLNDLELQYAPDLTNVKSQLAETRTLKDKINFASLFAIDKDSSISSMQGMCVTDQHIVFACITSDENNNTYLYVVDKNTFALVNTITTYNFEHANGMTYNPANNTIAIAHCINNGVQNGKISIVDASLLATANPSNLVTNVLTMGYTVQALAYNDGKYYLVQGNQKTVIVTDSNFVTLSTFELDNNVIVQGMDVYKGGLFVSRFNLGSNTFSTDVLYTNFVEMYTLEGKLEKRWIVPKNIVGSEIEGFCHLGDGKFISNFNGSRHYFYTSEVFNEKSSYLLAEVEDYFPVNVTSKTLYVQESYTGTVSDGTESKPFRNLTDLIYFLHKLQNTQPVIVRVKGALSKGATFSSIRHSLRIEGLESATIPYLRFGTCMQVTLNGITVNGVNTDNFGVVFDRCPSVYVEACAIAYNGTAPSGYVPFYSLQSNVVFENGVTTLSNAKYVALQATGSNIHVYNGITGTNNTQGMRLKNSLLTLEPGSLELGVWDNIIIGGSRIIGNDESLWSGDAYTGTIALSQSIKRFKTIKLMYETGSFYHEFRVDVSKLSVNATRSIHDYNLLNSTTADFIAYELQATIADNSITIDITSKLTIVGGVHTKTVYATNGGTDYIKLKQVIGEY
jgi:hypothetical protein